MKPYDGKLECVKIISEKDDMDAKAAASGEAFAKLGENIVVKRLQRFEIGYE